MVRIRVVLPAAKGPVTTTLTAWPPRRRARAVAMSRAPHAGDEPQHQAAVDVRVALDDRRGVGVERRRGGTDDVAEAGHRRADGPAWTCRRGPGRRRSAVSSKSRLPLGQERLRAGAGRRPGARAPRRASPGPARRPWPSASSRSSGARLSRRRRRRLIAGTDGRAGPRRSGRAAVAVGAGSPAGASATGHERGVLEGSEQPLPAYDDSHVVVGLAPTRRGPRAGRAARAQPASTRRRTGRCRSGRRARSTLRRPSTSASSDHSSRVTCGSAGSTTGMHEHGARRRDDLRDGLPGRASRLGVGEDGLHGQRDADVVGVDLVHRRRRSHRRASEAGRTPRRRTGR